MPPMTAAANALMPGSRIPITAGWFKVPKLMPQSTPPAAASMEPSRNVVAITRFTFTPIICATSASCAEARIALPSRVRRHEQRQRDDEHGRDQDHQEDHARGENRAVADRELHRLHPDGVGPVGQHVAGEQPARRSSAGRTTWRSR
ncbi:MAG: hypothetical protein U5J97_01985 [Trueperaceae bacterium]|nr:hypothetical protein [Trueperaceae bacterium]